MPATHDDHVDVTRVGSHRSAQVALDFVGRAHGGLARVATGFAQRPTLPKQVPALVEFGLDAAQPLVLLGFADIAVLQLRPKCLLLGDQVVDPRQGGVVWVCRSFLVLFHESSVPD